MRGATAVKHSAFIEHKPHLLYPWQILVRTAAGKTFVMYACKEEAAARRRLAKLQEDQKGWGDEA